MTKNKNRFDHLSESQREAIYRQCERIGADAGEMLTAQDRERHRRAGLRVGRPQVGKGAKRINVSMERGLLNSADALAKKRGISRAQLIAESVKAYLNSAA